MLFSDLMNDFQVIDYSPSHNQLLIRSKSNKNRDYNIDIVLKGVLSILIPTVFKGIEISLFEMKDDNNDLIEKYDFKLSKDYHVFCLKDIQGKTYFINAMCFGVYHNKLDILETSIGRYDFGNLAENILWYD